MSPQLRNLLERVKLFMERDDIGNARYSKLNDAELAEAFAARCIAAEKEGDAILADVKALLSAPSETRENNAAGAEALDAATGGAEMVEEAFK